MPSPTYRLFRQAILEEKQVLCTYEGCHRELCPHIIGYKDGEEKVLAFQFGGQSTSELPPGGEWRCLYVSKIANPRMRTGAWHTGPYHRATQKCVDEVDLDVNAHVRRRPKTV